MNRVRRKVAIVTGGAAGLGEAMAVMLAHEGAKVVVTDVNAEDGMRVADAIKTSGGDAFFTLHDVADEEAWKDVIAATVERFGRLDVLVNNAGIAFGGPPEELTLERWRRLMSINLDGVFLGTKHAIIAMKKNEPPGGSIINLSSIEGIVGDPNLGAYNASRAAYGFTQSRSRFTARKPALASE